MGGSFGFREDKKVPRGYGMGRGGGIPAGSIRGWGGCVNQRKKTGGMRPKSTIKRTPGGGNKKSCRGGCTELVIGRFIT